MTENAPDEVQGDGRRSRRQGAGFSLSDVESAAPRRLRLAKAAAQHLPLSDITAEIKRMSESDTGILARRLKTRSNAPTPALAQALRSGTPDEVSTLILTASGGAFRGRRREELVDVTVEQALAHPTWNMGPVVTINSATLVNKGLELIEAHLLFGIGFDRIEVVVHPQSVIHSMVEFTDGSTLAQCSPPDMRLPIALALGWPHRVPAAAPAVDWAKAHTWELTPLDDEAFPAVALAKAAGEAGRCRPAIFNAANEECVAAFTAGRLPFLGIVETVEATLADAPDFAEPGTVEDVLAAEDWARTHARDRIAAITGTATQGVGKGA